MPRVSNSKARKQIKKRAKRVAKKHPEKAANASDARITAAYNRATNP